jgi:kinesin family protein 2/24
VYEECV